jgi:mRNA-degrading endonuclease RelE of RelBE toxin-antitoxin system
VRVLLNPEGRADFDALPRTMQVCALAIFERLQNWPDVSGAKSLRGKWAGHYRIRTGDWRVLFRVIAPDVIVVRIMHRSTVYED